VAASHLAKHAVLASAIALATPVSCTSVLGIETTEFREDAGKTSPAPRYCDKPESNMSGGAVPGPIELSFFDFLLNEAAPNISVSVCTSFTDQFCGEGNYAGCARSDALGKASVSVPLHNDDWLGYLLVTAPEHEVFYYFFAASIHSAQTPYVIPHFLALKTADWKMLQEKVLIGGNALHAPPAPGRGQITVNVLNTDGSRRAGQVLELYSGDTLVTAADAAVTQFYLKVMGTQGVPSVNETSTDASGFGGFLNVNPNTSYVVKMRDKETPGVYSGSIGFFLVADTWSTMDLTPNLLPVDAGTDASSD
jgi:hypothetical protein